MSSKAALEKLHSTIIENTAEIFKIDLEENIGEGEIIQVRSKSGVVYSKSRIKYSKKIMANGNGNNYIKFYFCLGNWNTWCDVNGKTLTVCKDEVCIYKKHLKNKVRCIYKKDLDYFFKVLQIPISYFEEILRKYFKKKEIESYTEKLYKEFTVLKITPYVRHILKELDRISLYKGGLSYLYFEGKVLELISHVLSEVLEFSIYENSTDNLSAKDLELAFKIKGILDKNITSPPIRTELADELDVSVSKLDRVFSKAFDSTIYTYIVDQRLEIASNMLMENYYNIGEIANIVGYKKASNFSDAFRKKFGLLPKDYRKIEGW